LQHGIISSYHDIAACAAEPGKAADPAENRMAFPKTAQDRLKGAGFFAGPGIKGKRRSLQSTAEIPCSAMNALVHASHYKAGAFGCQPAAGEKTGFFWLAVRFFPFAQKRKGSAAPIYGNCKKLKIRVDISAAEGYTAGIDSKGAVEVFSTAPFVLPFGRRARIGLCYRQHPKLKETKSSDEAERLCRYEQRIRDFWKHGIWRQCYERTAAEEYV
jgi:hypothetical protein